MSTPQTGNIVRKNVDGTVRYVVVENHHDEIKNGRPGFDGWVATDRDNADVLRDLILADADWDALEAVALRSVWSYDSEVLS